MPSQQSSSSSSSSSFQWSEAAAENEAKKMRENIRKADVRLFIDYRYNHHYYHHYYQEEKLIESRRLEEAKRY